MKKIGMYWVVLGFFFNSTYAGCSKCGFFPETVQHAAKMISKRVGVCKVGGAALGFTPFWFAPVIARDPSASAGEMALGFAALGVFGGFAGAQMGRRIGLELSQPYIKDVQNVLCRGCRTGKIESDAREILFKVAMSKLR